MDLEKGHTRAIIDACKKRGLLRNQCAYVLATAWHETAHTMLPVKEAYWLSESWRRKNLRYFPWYGRGFVQLTWETNYRKAKKETGVDVVSNPDRAMEPKVAAEILVVGMQQGWFTEKKLSDYITLSKSDFRNARKIVNGMDKASLIASHAEDYDALLKAEGYGVDPAPSPSPKPSTKPVEPSGGFWAFLVGVMGKLFRRGG